MGPRWLFFTVLLALIWGLFVVRVALKLLG